MVLVVSQLLTRLDLQVNPRDLSPSQTDSSIKKDRWPKSLNRNKRYHGSENDNFFSKVAIHVVFVAYLRDSMKLLNKSHNRQVGLCQIILVGFKAK